MEAALSTFSTCGFRATTLEQVAEAASVTKGAIYHYFEGKEDLLLKSMNHWMATHFKNPKDLIKGDQGPASSRLRLLIRGLWSWMMEPGTMELFRLIEGELVPEYPELIEKWYTVSVAPTFRQIDDLVEEGKGTGEFRKDLDTTVAVRFITMGLFRVGTMVHQAERMRLTEFANLSADRAIDSIVDVMFRGIGVGSSG